MGKKTSRWLFGILLLLLIGIGLFSWRQKQQKVAVSSSTAITQNQQKAAAHQDTIPTIYLHGYGAGARSTNSMITYAEEHDNAHRVLTATISRSGQVKLSGSWPKNTKRPLIQVVLKDNTNNDYFVTREWIHNLLLLLKRKYHISRYNTVAHSMGNLTFLFYQIKYGQNNALPKLKKQVNLGAPFNGIIGMDDQPNRNRLEKTGKPKYFSSTYQYLLEHRMDYPRGVDILNIFGNKEDGTNSDDAVSVTSARSLRYLVETRAASYHEIEVKGPGGQHSKLHENKAVAKKIDKFLWHN